MNLKHTFPMSMEPEVALGFPGNRGIFNLKEFFRGIINPTKNPSLYGLYNKKLYCHLFFCEQITALEDENSLFPLRFDPTQFLRKSSG